MDELEKKVLTAIHRIEELYFETDGLCRVSFSGGKDSTVILALIKMSIDSLVLPQDGIKAVFFNTGVELQATIDFVSWCKESGFYENIEIIKPDKSFAYILKTFGKPMKSKIKSEYIDQWHNGEITESLKRLLIDGKTRSGKRSCKTVLADKDMHMIHDDFDINVSKKCCRYLKKDTAERYNKEHDVKGTIVGIRAGEGGAREMALKRRINTGGKLCTYYNGSVMIKAPIIDWSDSDVELFVKKYDVPLSMAYTSYGMKRTGCAGCPYALGLADNLKILYYCEPQRYKASMFFLKDVYIAQGVELPFDEQYEKERISKWNNCYDQMRNEMLAKYRPNSKLLKRFKQMTIQDYLAESD